MALIERHPSLDDSGVAHSAGLRVYPLADGRRWVAAALGGWVPGVYVSPADAVNAAYNETHTDRRGPARTAPDDAGQHRTVPDTAAAEAQEEAALVELEAELKQLDELRTRLRVAETANEILRTELRRALREQR